jgi:hypothetical protein
MHLHDNIIVIIFQIGNSGQSYGFGTFSLSKMQVLLA